MTVDPCAAVVPRDALEWALESLARLHPVRGEAREVARGLPPKCDLHALLAGLRGLGLEARASSGGLDELRAQRCTWLLVVRAAADPCVDDGAGGRPSQPGCAAPVEAGPAACAPPLGPGCTLGLLVPRGAGMRYVEPGAEPVDAGSAALASRYTGTALAIAADPKSAARAGPEDPDAAAEPPRQAFGLRWFLRELLRQRTVWRDVVLASAAIQVLALGMPLLTQVVIDKVIAHHATSTLLAVAAAMAAIVAFGAGMSWARQALMLHTGTRVDAVLGPRVFHHLLQLPMRYFEQRATGALVARLQGVETIRQFLAGAATAVVLDIPFALVFLAIMLHYSVTLSLIALAVITAMALLGVAVTPVLRARVDRQFLAGARMQGFLAEYLAAMETVKALQLEQRLHERHAGRLSDYLDASLRARALANASGALAGALEQALTVAVLCTGAWLVMTEQAMTLGMLVAFQMFASRMAAPVLRLVGLWQEFQQVEIAVRRLRDIMDAPVEPASGVPAREHTGACAIRARGLGYRYGPAHAWLFRGLDLHADPGDCVVVTGPSGSGKSTLAGLLLGFHVPVEGGLEIDGVDSTRLAVSELRGRFGVVPQDTVLFADTVLDNLLPAGRPATLEEVADACRLAEIHDAIERLPHGYATRLGEHGCGLSGGQKQRLAIARALLRRPGVLLLDEATSNLDPDAAAGIVRTVNRLRGRVTILLVAHEIPAGLDVDRVVRLGGSDIGKAKGLDGC